MLRYYPVAFKVHQHILKKEVMARTKTLTTRPSVDRDELADLIIEVANKTQKDGSRVAFYLDEQEDPSMITDWVSTGSTMLDLAVSNRKNGGLPAGRICSFSGLESTGKSLLCAHLLANTQKKGGVGVMIDTEFAAAPDFWHAVGVDIPKLPYLNLITVEEIFSKIESFVGTVRKSNKDRLLTIVVDSLAQASTEKEMESDHGVDGYNTAKSIIVSKALRKIMGLIAKQRILLVFTNQLRMNMKATAFSDPYIEPTGKALAFGSSVRIRLSNAGQIKDKSGSIIGNECKAVVLKNRCGPPKRVATFELHFDSGIQDLKSWLDFLKKDGMITGDTRGWNFSLPENSVKYANEKFKLSTSEFIEKVNSDEGFKDAVYSMICEKQIMKYRDPNSKIDEETQIEDSVEDE